MGDEEERTSGSICDGGAKWYMVFVRWRGYQKWEPVGKGTKSEAVAVRRLATTFAKDAGHQYKRGIVTMSQEYYDPEPILEMVRR